MFVPRPFSRSLSSPQQEPLDPGAALERAARFGHFFAGPALYAPPPSASGASAPIQFAKDEKKRKIIGNRPSAPPNFRNRLTLPKKNTQALPPSRKYRPGYRLELTTSAEQKKSHQEPVSKKRKISKETGLTTTTPSPQTPPKDKIIITPNPSYSLLQPKTAEKLDRPIISESPVEEHGGFIDFLWNEEQEEKSPLFEPKVHLVTEKEGKKEQEEEEEEEEEEKVRKQPVKPLKDRSSPIQLPEPAFEEALSTLRSSMQHAWDERAFKGYKRLLNRLITSKGPPQQGFYQQARVVEKYRSRGKILGVEEKQGKRPTWTGEMGRHVSADAVVKTKTGKSFFRQPEKIVEVKYRPSASKPVYEQMALEELKEQIRKDLEQTGRVKLWWHGTLPNKINEYVEKLHATSKGAFTYQTFQ